MKAEKVRELIGKQIYDMHERPIGRIVGYYANTKNLATSVEVELSNGDFFNCPISQISLDEDHVNYIHPWEFEANGLKQQFDLISRRIKALDELFRNGDIDKELYEELKTQHTSAIEELQEQKNILMESLNERNKTLEGQIKELEIFLANSKMQHMSGEIDDKHYQVIYDAVNNGFKRILSEKKFLTEVLNFLSATDLSVDESSWNNPKHAMEDKIPDMVYVKMKENA